VRIVLDTNVLISGVLNPRGAPGSILSAVLNKSVNVLFDDRILTEYREVLQRPKFQFPDDYIETLLEFMEFEGVYVVAGPSSATLPDSDDLPFYEVAVAGGADYLVTENDRHFPVDRMVVSPRAFLDTLSENDERTR
jgi:uncharacterized protein